MTGNKLNAWRLWLLALVALCSMTALTSCGDDEPKETVIGYYLEVEEEFLVNGDKATTYRFYNPVVLTREAIRTVYPESNAQGADDAVIAACDEVMVRYYDMYQGHGECDHLTCSFNLMRAHMSDGIVRSSELLKSYNYDVNPPEIPE